MGSGEWEAKEGDDDALFGGFSEHGLERSSGGHRDFEVWRLSMDLAVDLYAATRRFPAEEKFGLISQLRRAAASIPANIAEGYGRETSGAFIQFLRIAQGSAKELETLIELSKRLDLIDKATVDPIEDRMARVSKMLRALIRSIERRR
jgi:four helix bundle protein